MQSEKVVPLDGETGGLKARLAAKFKKRPEESPERKVRGFDRHYGAFCRPFIVNTRSCSPGV